MPATARTLEALYKLPSDVNAELVNGKLVFMSPTGDLPATGSKEVLVALENYLRRKRSLPGRAYPDNTGFEVDLPHRKSFSPDVSYYVGPRTKGRFLRGAPLFVVEIRSENDYGPKAERAIRAKRADYFAAGTTVVWDIDVLHDECIRVYRSSEPDFAKVYRQGQRAQAEPVLPGWRFPVSRLFVE